MIRVLQNKDKEIRTFKVIMPSPVNHSGIREYIGVIFKSPVKKCGYKGANCCRNCPGYVVPPWQGNTTEDMCFGLRGSDGDLYLYIQEI